MWQGLFFKYTSAVVALMGIVIGISMCLIHELLLANNNEFSHIIASLFVSIILALVGYICGKLMQNLHHSAHRDELTNLWNSRYFYSKLTKEIEKMKKTKSSLCIAFIDLDNFKMINDTYGHIAGDEVLRGIATILAGNTRYSDIVVRWGGDEFVIIFPDTNLANASLLVERLRRMIEGSRDCRQVTISVGVLLVEAEMEVSQLLKMADDTLYKAKKTKNFVVLNTHL
ncbi:MAG: pleD 3 [Firmicutes bacterium]|nr:pleD 3 [Bacillota bacterium]